MVPDAKTIGITVCMVFCENNDVSLISIVDQPMPTKWILLRAFSEPEHRSRRARKSR
jgi:hypothetical protein